MSPRWYASLEALRGIAARFASHVFRVPVPEPAIPIATGLANRSGLAALSDPHLCSSCFMELGTGDICERCLDYFAEHSW